MPITSHIDNAEDLTVFTASGTLTFDDAMFVVKAFYAGDPTKHVLWDLTETTEVELSSEEIEKIATYEPRIGGKRPLGKTAFVAEKDILFGLARMFETHSSLGQSPYLVMVFRSKDEAYKWLCEP